MLLLDEPSAVDRSGLVQRKADAVQRSLSAPTTCLRDGASRGPYAGQHQPAPSAQDLEKNAIRPRHTHSERSWRFLSSWYGRMG